MKIEQAQYILAIYETGSISKAASRFYMSRPNLSNSVRALEQELGFEILERGARGVRFTKKGQALLRHCGELMKAVQKIQCLSDETARLQFGVVNPNCPAVEDAFVRLCAFVEQQPELHQLQLSIYREYQYEGMRLLNQNKADLAVTVSDNMRAPMLQQELEERGLQYRKLWDAPCNINLSEHHPLLREPEFQLQKLRDYPFVCYVIEKDRGSPFEHIGALDFIDLSKLIRVDSGAMRTKLVSVTNAYSVGIAMRPSWAREHHLRCIPIKGLTMEIGCIRRFGEPVTPAERQFLTFLREEMAFLAG